MSKTILIKRKPNTTNLPDHVYDSAKKRIGSTYNQAGDVNTGLSMGEIERFMPNILGASTADPAFYKKVKDWFMNLSIDVPPAGVELEVGLDKEGLPINVMDYVRYKFANLHPYVLLDEKDGEEVRKKRRYMFILEDKEKESQLKIAGKNERKKAYAEYIKVSANADKMEQVLRVLGEFPDNLDPEEQEMRLEKFATDEPAKFLKIVTNPDLDMRAFIRQCLSFEVLRKVGNSYLDGEEVLGSSEDETVIFLKDKKNSNILVDLKAKLKQFKK